MSGKEIFGYGNHILANHSGSFANEEGFKSLARLDELRQSG